MKLTCAIVLVVFTMLQQGPSPAPRATPRPEIASQEATDRDKRDATTKGQTPNQSPSPTERASSPNTPDKNTGLVAPKNEEQNVRVVSVPPITVNGSETEFVGLIATIVLAAVGIVGMMLAIWTLKIIERQTKATETAAIAAKDSADALIASERAWIMVDIKMDPARRGIMEGTRGSGNVVEHSTNIPIICICRNQGRSPAWITNKRINFEIVDSIPPIPRLESTEMFQAELEPLGPGRRSNNKVDCNCGGRLDVPQIGIIYGIVEYRDIFDRLRTTTFGYAVTTLNTIVPRRLERVSGFPKYNENT